LGKVGLLDRLLCAPAIAPNYVLLDCRTPRESHYVQEVLSEDEIEFRFWYGSGVQGHTYFKDISHQPLDVTLDIASRVLGLPVAQGLTVAEIKRVVSAIQKGIASAAG
jgi:dTDP-4-amino-4,6-dideoxygalactose transaminase